jgi:hypothetical protein
MVLGAAFAQGLAYFLHRPMVCDYQTRGQSLLTGAAPSHRATVGGGAFLGVRSSRDWIFDVVMTIGVPMRSNLMWRSSPLPGPTYPA